MGLSQYFHDFGSLFFPEICPGCDRTLIHQEKGICTDCLFKLPYTHFHQEADNIFARQLWGLVPIEAAASYLYYAKESRVQRIIYHLKYQHTPHLGEWLGECFGRELKLANPYHMADLIIPVPLHPAKLKKRGYNQAFHIAKGLSRAMGIPVQENNLVRHSNNTSQTKKNRHERYENAKEIFNVRKPLAFAHKSIILVDDVVTTGATMEACAQELLKIEGTKIMLVSLAHGR